MDNSSGKMGERYVLQMLLEQGYTFIDANYHSRFGEIDIIVKDNKYIVFVEVKTRETFACLFQDVCRCTVKLINRINMLNANNMANTVKMPIPARIIQSTTFIE